MTTGKPGWPAAVLWDMDGTLLDSEKLWDIALGETVAQLGGSLSEERRMSLVGASTRQVLSSLAEAAGLEPTPEVTAKADKLLMGKAVELFAGGMPWRLGAQEALAAFHGAGIPLALVTSTERCLVEMALNTIGRDAFKITICGDEVEGLNKPHPEPYLRAARMLGVQPEDCMAIEDSPTGVASATTAGCTVLVVPSEVPVEPGERRIFRESLIGVDVETLAGLRS